MTNINEMKDVFLSLDKNNMLLMLDYIKSNLGISEADYWNYIGYYVICVPYDRYESALVNGKRFASNENIGMCWIDHYNVRRTPIVSSDIAYGILPKTLIPGEENPKYAKRILWGYMDENTPKTILEYFDSMKEFLNVDKIIREYHFADDAITISTLGLDYEEKSKRFKEFVETFGYGPFSEIHPLTVTGKYVEEAISLKKK